MPEQMLAVGTAAARAAGRHLVARAGAAVQGTKLDARDLVTAVGAPTALSPPPSQASDPAHHAQTASARRLSRA